MYRLLRILFNAVSVLWLLLTLLVAGLWVRSYTSPTELDFYSGRSVQVASYGEGTLTGMYRWSEPFTPHPGGGASGGGSRSLVGDGSFGIAVIDVWTPQKAKLRGYIFTAPHWMVVAFALIVSALAALPLLMQRRLSAEGRCPSCGYDLRATPERCPECGTVPTTPAAGITTRCSGPAPASIFAQAMRPVVSTGRPRPLNGFALSLYGNMTTDPYFPTIRQLAEYEVWCNRTSLEAAAQLPSEQLFHVFAFGFGTVHATLFHLVEVFQTWSGCVGPTIRKPPMVSYDPEMPLDRLAAWHSELADAFLGSVDASHAQMLLGCDRRLVQVFHLVTHGTHHRTQFITMLRLLGLDPPFEAGDFGGWSQPMRPE